MVGVASIVSESSPAALEALNLSSPDPNWYADRIADDKHAIAKLRSRLQVGTIIYRPTYEVDYYEIYEVEEEGEDWLSTGVYGVNVLYSARPVHSRALGNVREYWARDSGICFWLSEIFKAYCAYDGLPRDLIIAGKSFAEVEAYLSDKFPQHDLRDRAMCDYLRKCGGWA